MRIVVRNWRDQEPYVGHISALVWTLYQSHDKDETSPPEINRLNGISSFVKHGLQGHQHSDHHHHTDIEQLYFVLRGRGQLTIGDDKVDVRDGTAVYMPVNVPHQAFNDGDGWMEHLIVSCPLDEVREGTPAVCDWRDVHPIVLEGGTISWPLLQREEEADASDGGVLQRVHSVTRYAVQGRQDSAWQKLDTIELVHFVLSGYGSIEDQEGNHQVVTEGSAAHVLPGVEHRFVNQGEGWFEFVTFAVDVGEIEMPLESETDADDEDEQSGDEEAAASVLAEVDWDEADAVDTEEEIEEAVAVETADGDDGVASADEMEEEADADEAEDGDGEDDEEGDEDEEGEDDEGEDDEGEDDEGGGEIEAEDDDSSDAYGTEAEKAEDGDGADEDVASDEETDDADEAEDDGDDGEADEGGDEVDDADEDDTDGDDGVADLTEEASDEAAEVEDAEEEAGESDEGTEEEESDEEEAEASTNSDSDDDSADNEDEIELEDDDADFDIEDEDEPAVGDDHEDEDDSPDPYRR